ncbi:hypothetical protein [Sphingomonas endolithica]|uniref:hypothetical protein n=1 Tax=Sphingomonas endolithica TaxID=2972485 RepID=UPI0021B06197|nr:hypothetical protein [Sphingomonas sp. ZFBP2030]
MRLLVGILALSIVTSASTGRAQSGKCADDNGRDRCAIKAQQKQQDAYGVDAIDDLASKGSQVIRAFFVDGYGRDAGLVNFVRGPASEPRVEWLQSQAGKGGAPRTLLSAIVSLGTWEALQADGHAFDRQLAPQPETSPAICFHGWMVRVETVDARGRSHQSTQSACDPGLTVQYGFKVAKAAVESLPSCSLLDPERTRNDVTRLSECSLLTGDRAAAAQAYNIFRTPWFTNPRGPDFARPLQYLFYDQAEISWAGLSPTIGSEAASKLWAEQAANSFFALSRVHGETPDRVRIEGTILFAGAPGGKERRVPATMIWTRENGFGFRLRSLVAGSPNSG